MRTASLCRKSASLILLLLLFVITLHAGTFLVFGPKNYVRGTGSPVTVTDTFSVLNPSTQYTLKAYNGGLTNSATELVSSSVVTLNGVQVIGPNNFSQNVTEVDVPVTLQASNTLSVQVRGQPGGVLAIQIVGVDNDPPTIKAAVSPAPNAAGWNNTSVTVTFTCSDATSGVANCPSPQTVTTEGANQVISGTATDNAGNTASTSVTLNISRTPPKVTASSLPAANSNGWNNSNVTVSFTCTATTAPIGACSQPQTVSTEGAGQIISGTATDLAGNTASASATINLDKTSPIVIAAASPTANVAGWNNTTVTVTFSCNDATSGIASCPPAQSVTTEGANQIISGTATDKAGNTASASVALNIAKTAPKIIASALPPPNPNGWNNSNVTVSFSCSPTNAPVATCTSPQVVNTDGANQIITGTATDAAGNTSTVSATINLDKTPPIITATASPPPNAAGVNTTNVTVTFTCSDATSGIASCPPPQLVTTTGANQVISGTATDNAGNSATASVTLTIIKSTPPVIAATVSPPPNAAGWNNSAVTVTFTCSGGSGGIASCTPPVTVSTEGANQVVTGTAVDQAGQTATASVTLNLDLTPPTISAAVSPSPNGAGWNNSNVTVSFQCKDSLSGVATCPAPIPVTNEGVAVVTSPAAVDVAGNTATTSVLVKLDKTPPTITITSPATGSNVFASQTTVSGNAADSLSGVSSVSCNGAAAQLTGPAFSCVTTLSTGANSVSVSAVDLAGNQASANTSLTLIPAPVVTITSPANLSFTNISPITVRGTVDNSADTVTINGIAAFPSNGTFSAQVPLNEGINTLTALASNGGGNQGTASVNVTLDTTPPHLTIDSPANNSVTTNSSVTVTGAVNDIVVGTVNDQNAQVTVNGSAAQVANRTYSIATVPLALGANTIQAVARDQAGNATTLTITITRVSANQPPAPAIGQAVVADNLTIVSGNNQSAAIGAQLTAPLVISLTDPSGKPVPNQPVVFKVTGNDGLVATSVSSGPSLTVNTDTNGFAQVSWTLGHRSGVGVNRVEASSAVAFNVVDFAAIGVPGGAAQIVVDSGDNQSGIAGQTLTFPLGVVVTDAGHNRISGVPVTFTPVTGGGSLNGVQSQTVTTDSDGRALATLTLGPATGATNIVQANFAGNLGAAAAFTASAKLAGDPTKTTISGEVMDNSNNPIPNVTVRLYQTNQGSNNNLPLQIGTAVQTDVQGHFVMTNAPYGYFKLMADGSTAGGGVTSYPTLEYDIVTVAGQDNSVGTPIYLPVLNTVNKVCVDATHGGMLTLPQSPGFSLTVAPGAATFPGGSRQGCVSVSTVNGDKVPMAPGFGQQPRFIVTIQPVGTTFNPPAAMTLPNVDGLAPRAKTEMYSYDHDLSMFVAIGTATVSDDGSVIASDPGTGVLKAGWHCGGDPNAAGSVADCGECMVCAGPAVGCVPNDGAACGPPQARSYDLPVDGGAVHVNVGAACITSICMNGSCAPPANGFDPNQLKDGLSEALSKIFDNSIDACIEADLRQQMQNALLKNGVLIDCKPEPPGERTCAQQTTPVSNHLTLFSSTFTEPLCNGVAATILHELIHGPGRDPGSPDSAYHNLGSSAPAGIDCRDRPYGCVRSCFNAGGGNAFACLETPFEMGGNLTSSNGCGPCKSVTFTYTDDNGDSHTETKTVCPSTF